MHTPVAVLTSGLLGSAPTAEQLKTQLAGLPDWERRYQAVIALGDSALAEAPQVLDAADRLDANRLHGCEASVWVVHHFDVDSGRLYFLCDSDSRIVRGLLACILCLYNGRPPVDILATDARPWLREVGLVQHIASTRSNGIWAMIGKIKAVASRY